MKRTPLQPTLSDFPELLQPLLRGCNVYDSSCSKAARVFFLDRDGGLFLKKASRGTLKAEAEMTGFFHRKGLGAEVLSYLTLENDWLLTRQIPGEDCTHPSYLADPKRLCDTTATLLRQLHELDPSDCPVTDRNWVYQCTARAGFEAGAYDPELFPAPWGFSCEQEAWEVANAYGPFLKSEVLLHGDYCLPNILLRDWRFSGFIDLGGSGIGDRHIDIFWGVWTLFFNLKTTAFCNRFLDAYGRDRVQPELLRAVAALEVFR